MVEIGDVQIEKNGAEDRSLKYANCAGLSSFGLVTGTTHGEGIKVPIFLSKFYHMHLLTLMLLASIVKNRDTAESAVPVEGNGDLQTLICVLVARPRRCFALSNPVP